MTVPIQAVVDDSCRKLEATAAMMGIELSVVPASVEKLEKVLAGLQELTRDQSAISGATFMVGVYLGEILRRARNGTWHPSESEPLLQIASTTYAPVSKVRKYFANPRGGDGLAFFASAVLALET